MAKANDETTSDVLKSYIFNSNDPNVNQQLRQRIALAMMMQKKAAPKNAGEGITAIGEALGENRMRNQLEASDLAAQGERPLPAGATNPNAVPAGPPVASPYSPPSAVTQGDEEPPPVRTVRPPPATPATTSAPGGLLSRESAGGIVGPYANNPAQAASLLSPQPTQVAPPTGGPLPTSRFQPQNQPLIPPQRAPPMPVSNGGYNILDQAANAPPGPAVPANPAVRDAVATSLNGQPSAQAVPPVNPTAAGQPASPPLNRDLALSSDPGAGSPTGNMPQNTMALRAPADFGIKTAPPATPPIQQAPPPSQVAQALGLPGAVGTPGYVTPKQALPEAPPRIPMSEREAYLRNWVARRQGNPYAAGNVAPELNALEADRTLRQTQANELWKSKMGHTQTLDLKREDQLNKQYEQSLKEIQEAQKVQAGQHVTVGKRLMMPDPNKPLGAPWIDVTASMPGAKTGGDQPPQLAEPLNEAQQKTHKFWSEMVLAERQLAGKEKLLATSPYSDVVAKFGGNSLLHRDYQTARNAANFSVLADLRPDSGAAIGILEEGKRYKQLMPSYGDDDRTIANKREARRVIMDSMYANLGEARPLADWTKSQMEKRHDAEQAKINETMHARLGERPVGYVAKNAKTGESRVWNGKNWLDYTP